MQKVLDILNPKYTNDETIKMAFRCVNLAIQMLGR
jgi:hypothetical protein